MPDYGVTENGFYKKDRETILKEMENAAKNLFGDDINLSEKSPLGIILKIISYALALLWFVMEKVYNSWWVSTATEQSLDYVGEYIGISRRPATNATGKVLFKGDANTEIPAGFLIETEGSEIIQFETTESGVIDETGETELGIQAKEAGSSGNVSANTITSIVNPISGLDSVINTDATENGLDRETDFEFRQRYRESVSKTGGSTVDSIRAALLAVESVRTALVIENDTLDIVDNIPPKAIESVVLGGLDNDIAKAIFDSKAGGIEAYGETIVSVEDAAGIEHDIGFTRATEIKIYISLIIETNDEYPLDGDTQIKDQIIAYIGGYSSRGVLQNGIGLNEDIRFSRIVDAIHNVDGVTEVKSLRMGKNDWGTITGISSKISIATREVAETSLDYIEAGSIVSTADSYLNVIENKVAVNRVIISSFVGTIQNDIQTEEVSG